MHILTYKEALFGKFCALFIPSERVGSCRQVLGQLCKVKFENWKDATKRFSKHEKCHYQKQCVEVAGTLGDIASGKEKSIDEQLDTAAMQQNLDNRKNISPVIETVLFCGKGIKRALGFGTN